MTKFIHTLGTSNRSPEEFIGLLRAYGIEMVADVRSFPASRFPQFRREVLAQTFLAFFLSLCYFEEKTMVS
jgi:uncharacterized protein (DUF488 family)